MNNYIVGMFQIPLVHIELKNWNEKQQRLLDLLKYKGKADPNTENVVTDFYKNSENKYDYSNQVHQILKNDIDSFSIKFGLQNYKVKNSWIEISTGSMDHKVHNHGSLGYSAVCFLKYNPKVHKPTHFISPFNDFDTGSIVQYIPEGVKEGSLLFFPSVIHHYTVPSFSDEERIILSFNLNKKNDF